MTVSSISVVYVLSSLTIETKELLNYIINFHGVELWLKEKGKRKQYILWL